MSIGLPSYDAALERLTHALFERLKSDSATWAVIDRYHPLPADLQSAIDKADLPLDHREVLHDPIFGASRERAPEMIRLETVPSAAGRCPRPPPTPAGTGCPTAQPGGMRLAE